LRLRATLAGLLLLAAAQVASACTTFCVRSADGPVFGRNYDYFFGDGMVLVNPRGVEKVALVDQGPARWTSRYGSLTFNQYGKDSPMGGLNEKGLAIELMWLDETRYPEAASGPAVSTLEYIQYLLDNYATVAEALEGSRHLGIRAIAPLHFLVADRSGDTATIEFLDGRRVVHRGDKLPHPVLTNHTYEQSREYVASRAKAASTTAAFTDGSLDRFALAAQLVKPLAGAGRGRVVDASFEVLDAVAQKRFTRWQIVYDLARATVHFRTAANRERRTVELAGLDFSCGGGARMLDIDAGRGDVTAAFLPYSAEGNERMMLAAFAKSPQFAVPPQAVRLEAARIETRRCTVAG
jgi:penicillin V acylase-like amidase (Ntn superfamily)